jgi:Tol biopolymer transport system component
LRTSVVLLAAAVLAVSLAGCGGSGTSRGADSLVFVSTRDGPYQLYASKADGSDQHRLTSDKGDASTPEGLLYQVDPAWSPGATRIAFASSRSGQLQLYVVDADGKNTTRLTTSATEDKQPAWSPDGRRIAFQRGAPSRVYVMSAKGSGAGPLTSGSDEQTDPAWSPDGRWIAFARRTPGTSIREIWVAHPDGTEARPVTKLEASSTSPSWSPDGRRIAFASNARGGHIAVYVIGLDGTGLRQMSTSSTDEIEPAWSPDGLQIAFSRDGAIVAVPAAGGAETVLTDSKNNDSSPAWKPVRRP